jgi:hypothetical protein
LEKRNESAKPASKVAATVIARIMRLPIKTLKKMKKLLLLTILALTFANACSKPKGLSSAVNQLKIETLYRASKKIEASTTVSVTFAEFRNLVQALATEISIAKDGAVSSEEKRLVSLFDEAREAYSGSLSIWNVSIEQSAEFSSRQMIECKDEILNTVTKYKLDCLPYGRARVLPKESIQYLWTLAQNNLNAANSLYLGNPPTDESAKAESIKNVIYGQLRATIDSENARLASLRAEEQRLRRVEEQKLSERRAMEKELAAMEDSRKKAEAAERKKIADQYAAERQRKKSQWEELIALSNKVTASDDVVCIHPEGILYHTKSCGALRKDAVCIRKQDRPPDLKACSMCKPSP